MNAQRKHNLLWTLLFAAISLVWIFPIVLVFINSFKQKAYISRNAFSIPKGKAFVGLENYRTGIEQTNLFVSFGWTIVVTVGAVLLILVCTSMCAWWIVRVNNWTAKTLYTLFLLNMIVPFQMVMFTLSKLADMIMPGVVVRDRNIFDSYAQSLLAERLFVINQMHLGGIHNQPIALDGGGVMRFGIPIAVYYYLCHLIFEVTGIRPFKS